MKKRILSKIENYDDTLNFLFSDEPISSFVLLQTIIWDMKNFFRYCCSKNKKNEFANIPFNKKGYNINRPINFKSSDYTFFKLSFFHSKFTSSRKFFQIIVPDGRDRPTFSFRH